MQVNFINVGANQMNWSAKIQELSHKTLEKQIKSKGALMSNHIDFTYDESTQKGTIFVGMFRNVGEFEVIDDVKK